MKIPQTIILFKRRNLIFKRPKSEIQFKLKFLKKRKTILKDRSKKLNILNSYEKNADRA